MELACANDDMLADRVILMISYMYMYCAVLYTVVCVLSSLSTVLQSHVVLGSAAPRMDPAAGGTLGANRNTT